VGRVELSSLIIKTWVDYAFNSTLSLGMKKERKK
jgi:hypothetical protein